MSWQFTTDPPSHKYCLLFKLHPNNVFVFQKRKKNISAASTHLDIARRNSFADDKEQKELLRVQEE